MSRYLHNRDFPSPGIERIQLKITGSHPNYLWSYSKGAVILGDAPTVIEIDLHNDTLDKSKATLTTYASSGVTAKHSPIMSFATYNSGQSAVLTIGLLPHQVVDFGLFVDLTHEKHPTMTIFCDPQASNDPIKTT